MSYAADMHAYRRLTATFVLLAAVLVAGGCTGAASAPLRYECRRAPAAIVVDGRLDDHAWTHAAWTPPFVDIEGDVRPRPRFRTRARMLWDDRWLYVAARLEEPHVWATLTEHDQIVFHDNDFEVFIDPDGDRQWYYEIEVNALNTIFDLILPRPYAEGGRADHDWNARGLQTAIHVEGTLNDPDDVDEAWTVEMAIPFDLLAEHTTAPCPPRDGDVWRVNFSRVQWRHVVVDGAYEKVPDAPEDNWVWTPQHEINMHRPRHWGYVEFVER